MESSDKKQSVKFCVECGAENRKETKYCKQCGYEFDENLYMKQMEMQKKEVPHSEKCRIRNIVFLSICICIILVAYVLNGNQDIIIDFSEMKNVVSGLLGVQESEYSIPASNNANGNNDEMHVPDVVDNIIESEEDDFTSVEEDYYEDNSDNSVESVSAEQVDTAKEKLLESITESNVYMRNPLAYCSIDLDEDCVAEIIVRNYTTQVLSKTGRGLYAYTIYQYDGEHNKYRKAYDNILYSLSSENCVFYETEEAMLLFRTNLDAMDIYTAYSLIEGHEDNAYQNKSSLIELEFEMLPVFDSEKVKLWRKFLESKEYLPKLGDANKIFYSICDIDGDDIQELLLKGINEETGSSWCYLYICADESVEFEEEVNIDLIGGIDFFLSPW